MKLLEWRPIKRGNLDTETEAHRENALWRPELCCYKPRNYQKLEGGPRSPSAFSGNRALPTHWFGISGLQDSGMINFCCSKSLFVLLCYSSPRKPIHLLIFPPLNSEIRICLTKVSPSHKQVVLWKFIVGTLRLEWSSPTENGSDFQACNNLSVKWTVLNK